MIHSAAYKSWILSPSWRCSPPSWSVLYSIIMRFSNTPVTISHSKWQFYAKTNDDVEIKSCLTYSASLWCKNHEISPILTAKSMIFFPADFPLYWMLYVMFRMLPMVAVNAVMVKVALTRFQVRPSSINGFTMWSLVSPWNYDLCRRIRSLQYEIHRFWAIPGVSRLIFDWLSLFQNDDV